MAKKKIDSVVVEEVGFDFNALTKTLQGFSPDSYILDESPIGRIENYIGLGNYLLNAQVSGDIFGGVPEGRSTIFSGLPGSAKTFICCNAVREAQKQGYFIFWIDTEAAIDLEMMERFNVDTKRLTLVPLNTVLETSTYITNLCNNIQDTMNKTKTKIPPKVMLVLDSLGNLSSDKEYNDVVAGSTKQDMTKPKELRKLFRVITQSLGKLKIPMLVTNHVYEKIDFIGGTAMTGGRGAEYNASIILEFVKKQLKEDGADKPRTGIIVTSKVKKCRFVRAGIDIQFHVSFVRGMNPYVGLQDYISWERCGVDFGKIVKGEFVATAGKTRIAVAHLGKDVPAKKLFTPEVFTQEVLEKLRPYIKEVFEFPNADNEFYDVEDLVDDDESTE